MSSRYSIEQARPKLGQILKDAPTTEQIITRNGEPAGMVLPCDAVAMRRLATFNDLFPHATDLTDYTIQLVDDPKRFHLEALETAIFREIYKALSPGILFTGKGFYGLYYDEIQFDIEAIRDSLPVDHMWKIADHYMREVDINDYEWINANSIWSGPNTRAV